MTERSFPGELEQMVLLAVARLGEAAYALEIIRELDRRAAREVSRGSLYKTLDRMETKGLVRWETASPTPSRGGHTRRRFEVTPEGVDALRLSRDALRNLWDGLDPLFGDSAG